MAQAGEIEGIALLVEDGTSRCCNCRFPLAFELLDEIHAGDPLLPGKGVDEQIQRFGVQKRFVPLDVEGDVEGVALPHEDLAGLGDAVRPPLVRRGRHDHAGAETLGGPADLLVAGGDVDVMTGGFNFTLRHTCSIMVFPADLDDRFPREPRECHLRRNQGNDPFSRRTSYPVRS